MNIDVPSTILDIANIEQPKTWHGKSLMPIVNNNLKKFQRDTVLIEHIWEFDNIPPSEGVRTKDWKYFRYVNDQSIEELYNLKDDPKEINNLSSDAKHQEKLKIFRKKTNHLIFELSDDYSMGASDLTIAWTKKTEDGIRDLQPIFGWLVKNSAVSQTAYQILVASSKENIVNNIGNVWNSEKTETNNSSEIRYRGAQLKNDATYYWKVRVWDQDNRLSRYSENQSFTTIQE